MNDGKKIDHKFHRWLVSAENREKNWRLANEKNFDYYDGEQWTEEEKAILEGRGQQATVLNVIRPTVDMVLALEVDKRVDIQVIGRNADDSDTAELLTELLKQVFDASDADYCISQSFREGIIGGRGWLYIDIERDYDDDEDDAKPTVGQIYLKWVPWEEVYIDPYHRKADGTDARFIIRKVWMDRDELKEIYPEKAERIDSVFNEAYQGTEHEAQMNAPDRAVENYYDAKSGRVCLCHCWYRNAKGKIRYVIFSDEIFLYGDPDEDEKNDPPHEIDAYPLIPFYAFRSHKGNPKGLVEFLTDAQDQINKLNSKFLWNMSANRLIYEEGALADSPEETRMEINRPNGMVALASGGLNKIKIEENLRESSYLSQHMQFLLAMIQRTSGINDSMNGLGGINERSAAQQQNRILQGASMQTQILENLHFAKKQASKVILMLIGCYYTDGIIVRITRPNKEYDYVAINQPTVDANTGKPSGVLNKIDDVLRYDVVLTRVPPFSTTRERTMQLFSEVAKTGIFPPQIVAQVMLEMADIPHKRELMQTAEAYYQQQAAMQQQQAAMQPPAQ